MGATEIIVSPSELVERLVVTIPPPHTNTVLYHGLFAGAHRWSSRVVPGPQAERAAVVARRRARKLTKTPSPVDDAKDSWAELLKYTFAKDGYSCPSCGGTMKLRAVISGPPASLQIVRSLLRSTGPP